jgi:hypothetical protein
MTEGHNYQKLKQKEERRKKKGDLTANGDFCLGKDEGAANGDGKKKLMEHFARQSMILNLRVILSIFDYLDFLKLDKVILNFYACVHQFC